MKINEILVEQQLDELGLGDIGRGIGKVVGGVAKGVGSVAGGAVGAIDAAKHGYQIGRGTVGGKGAPINAQQAAYNSAQQAKQSGSNNDQEYAQRMAYDPSQHAPQGQAGSASSGPDIQSQITQHQQAINALRQQMSTSQNQSAPLAPQTGNAAQHTQSSGSSQQVTQPSTVANTPGASSNPSTAAAAAQNSAGPSNTGSATPTAPTTASNAQARTPNYGGGQTQGKVNGVSYNMPATAPKPTGTPAAPAPTGSPVTRPTTGVNYTQQPKPGLSGGQSQGNVGKVNFNVGAPKGATIHESDEIAKIKALTTKLSKR